MRSERNWTVWFGDHLVDATRIPESFHVTSFFKCLEMMTLVLKKIQERYIFA